MDLFSVITLFGGLAFFLFGMHTMSAGLEKLAGGRLESTLKKMTNGVFRSLLLGVGITVAIQSSSAVTVMLVGLVNSGILELGQTVGVIMGSNIGTTLTAWLLSLAGIGDDNVFLRLLKPTSFAPIFALIGIILIMTQRVKKRRDIGSVFIGFAILMYGMTLMSDSVAPLADDPSFSSLLTAFSNPLLGVLVGAVFTGVIQSSAASVGILQALALTGSISYGMAIPIIMGQNIGTCVTALISSFGVNRNARRVAVVHISFNLIGTLACLSIFLGADAVFDFAFKSTPIGAVGIAAVHSIFNLATTFLLLPFSRKLVSLAKLVIPASGSDTREKTTLIDDRLLQTPSVAVAECDALSARMCELSVSAVNITTGLFSDYSTAKRNEILEAENTLDNYEDTLGTFLVKLSSKDISESDSREISKILHAIGDFERLGDHAVNLMGTADEIHDKGIVFTEEAKRELTVLKSAINDILGMTRQAYITGDIKLATRVEPLEQVIDGIIGTIRDAHIRRLQSGSCSIETGFVLSDLLANYERVSDHCSNLAVAVIECEHGSFDTHVYLNVQRTQSEDFRQAYEEYGKKYKL